LTAFARSSAPLSDIANHPLGGRSGAAVVDLAGTAEILEEVVDLAPLLLLREAVRELRDQCLVDVVTGATISQKVTLKAIDNALMQQHP